jgi:hypothetical protein
MEEIYNRAREKGAKKQILKPQKTPGNRNPTQR